jgi:hypothetical protein
MSEDIYHQISEVDRNEEDTSKATSVEIQLQKIWGVALNLPPQQISLHQSFLHLGGDSMSGEFCSPIIIYFAVFCASKAC